MRLLLFLVGALFLFSAPIAHADVDGPPPDAGTEEEGDGGCGIAGAGLGEGLAVYGMFAMIAGAVWLRRRRS